MMLFGETNLAVTPSGFAAMEPYLQTEFAALAAERMADKRVAEENRVREEDILRATGLSLADLAAVSRRRHAHTIPHDPAKAPIDDRPRAPHTGKPFDSKRKRSDDDARQGTDSARCRPDDDIAAGRTRRTGDRSGKHRVCDPVGKERGGAARMEPRHAGGGDLACGLGASRPGGGRSGGRADRASGKRAAPDAAGRGHRAGTPPAGGLSWADIKALRAIPLADWRKALLGVFLGSGGVPVGSDLIARRLGVNAKKISWYCTGLRRALAPWGYTISCKPGTGYTLHRMGEPG